MTKKSDKNMLIGLDIGTSKVVAIVGEVNSDGGIEIIGLGCRVRDRFRLRQLKKHVLSDIT